MVLIQPLRFNLSCPLVTALFTVKYIHLQIEDSTPVVDSYFKVLIISIIVVFTFFRICKEVDIVLGNKDTVEYDDISKLQFVRQTLKESLRKHPSASGTLRRTTKPEKFGSFLIPKGANINFPIYVAHHLPENWYDPECFNPDRFSDKNNSENKLSNFEYFRFSCGQRICMGKDFSSINASIVMAQLFRKFKFELVAGQTLQCEEKMTMRPKDRVLCTFQKTSDKSLIKSSLRHSVCRGRRVPALTKIY